MPKYGLNGPVPQVAVVGPFVGMRDTLALAAQDPQLAASIRNAYPPLPEIGAGLWSRPGFTRVGFTATLTGTATTSGGSAPFAVQTTPGGATSMTVLDSAGSSRTLTGTGTSFTTQVQVGDVITALNPLTVLRGGQAGPLVHIANVTFSGGTVRRLALGRWTSTAVVAGQSVFNAPSTRYYKLMEWNASNTEPTPSWTDRTSGSMAGTSLDDTGRIYSTTFANYWIVSDGVNRPWKMDSSFVRSNLTSMSVAAYGPPAVYYGKLFFIQASDRLTLLWSNENDPDSGYSGTQAWTLRQTNSDLMTAIIGTNDALYVFRENSITAITGAANDDFKSAGTLDAISNTTGTRSPDSVTLVESSVWFLDTYGRPSKIEPGRGLVPLWADCAKTVKDVAASTTNLALAWGRYDPAVQLVFFGYRDDSSATGVERVLVFSARTEQFVGTWDISGTTDLAYGAVLRDANNRPTIGMAHGGTSDVALYVRKQEGASGVAVDTLAASSPAPTMVVETGPLLGDPLTAKTISRVVVETEDVDGGQATLRLATKGPLDSAFSSTATMDTRDVGTGMPGRASVNVDVRQVRYAQFQVSNDTSDSDRVVVGRVALYADQTSTDPTLA